MRSAPSIASSDTRSLPRCPARWPRLILWPAAPPLSTSHLSMPCRGRSRGLLDSTIPSPARRAMLCISSWRAALRSDPPRCDVPALSGSRRDLQSRLSRVAGSLSARSGADDQDLGAWRYQHAGLGQAPSNARSSKPQPARFTVSPHVHPQRPIGATSTPSARVPATTRASAPQRRCSSTTAVSINLARSRSLVFSTPTDHECTRMTAAWSPTSLCRP